MKKSRIVFLLCLMLLLFVGCKKKCRCYRYDGNVEEFTKEELDDRGTTCSGMEDFHDGNVYSLCEKITF